MLYISKYIPMYFLFTLFLGLFLGTGQLSAQVVDKPLSPAVLAAIKHTAALKAGGLVVRLPSNIRKLAAMRAVLDTAVMDEQNRARLSRSIAATEAETRQQNLEIMTAFKQAYRLTPVVFVYDTASVQIRAGQRSGFVLTDKLELNAAASIPAGPFMSVRVGYSDPGDFSGAEGLIVGDAALTDVSGPFPAAVSFSNIGYLFGGWLNPSSASQKRYTRAVQKLSRKLREAVGEWGGLGEG